jgi:hypothetical protein
MYDEETVSWMAALNFTLETDSPSEMDSPLGQQQFTDNQVKSTIAIERVKSTIAIERPLKFPV